MTPEAWEKIKELFEAALTLPPEERSAFLAQACEGNPSLAGEVQRLLAGADRIGSFLDPPAWIRGGVGNPAGESVVPTVDLTSPAEVAAGAPSIGSTFASRYEVKGELGRGGFGIVYSAFDRGPLQRTVALKVIRFAAGEPSRSTALARQRFLEEAKVAGNLSHNNIATVYDVGEFAGCVYMTQELAPGRDLRKILAETGPLPLRRIIAISCQICEGLAHAHARNIVHRDIKPGNIVVGGEDQVKITDFGLAQPPQGDDDALNQAIAGTPGYMAPEQLRGERVDGRADIFAAGCVLYQMLTGREPFEGATPASVIDKTLHAIPTEPSRVRENLPRTLDRIVGRALRKDPGDRYDNVSQLQQDLINYEQFDYLTAGAAEIAAALEARQCTILLGLRLPVSADQKHPETVEQLIAEYLAERLSSPPKDRGLSRLAQELEMERGRPEMLKYLTAAVRLPQASPRELIRRVARLPFPVIVTTGYDTCLEDELAKLNRKVRRVINCRSVPDEPAETDLLVRLFGCVEDHASVLVTEEDLWGFFAGFTSVSESLKSALAKRWLIFIGFDAEDENFRRLLSEIARLRVDTTEPCYLISANPTPPAVRWAQRKALRLVEADTASFLVALEEAMRDRREQGSVTCSAPAETVASSSDRIEQQRILEAAIAKSIPLGRSTELLAMIRRAGSDGLRGVLEVETIPSVTTEDIKSKPFQLEFPTRRDGSYQPAEIILKLHAPDFEPKLQTKCLLVPPQGDSELCSFLLTPVVSGELVLNLEAFKGEIFIASRSIRVSAEIREPEAIPRLKNLVSIPLLVVVYESGAELVLTQAETREEAVTHAALEETVKVASSMAGPTLVYGSPPPPEIFRQAQPELTRLARQPGKESESGHGALLLSPPSATATAPGAPPPVPPAPAAASGAGIGFKQLTGIALPVLALGFILFGFLHFLGLHRAARQNVTTSSAQAPTHSTVAVAPPSSVAGNANAEGTPTKTPPETVPAGQNARLAAHHGTAADGDFYNVDVCSVEIDHLQIQ